jgi:hypothetical protein
VTRGGYRAPDRHAGQETPAPPDPPPPPSESPADAHPLDVAFFAGRFRADLSRLGSDNGEAETSAAHDDPALFDFFGNLNILLLAVRSGDLPRAQAAADALEMEVLVERSAGRRGEASPPHMLDDLGRLLGAAPTPDDGAAAKPPAAEFAPPTAPAAAPPPDPYAEHDADAGGAAYDTLSHYFDDEARV